MSLRRAVPLLGVLCALAILVTGCATPAPVRAADAPTTPTPPPSPSTLSTPFDGPKAPADFVALSDVDATIQQDIRYGTDHNFVGRPVRGYLEPVCILTRAAADALHRVQLAATSEGYSLKVYDCYRPQQAVDDFVAWAKNLTDQRMKTEFYPREDKSRLFDDGFIGSPTAHSRGATMDLTLVPRPTPTQPSYSSGQALVSCTAATADRFSDNTVDMGTGFDCFDPAAHTRATGINAAAMANRLELLKLMTGHGFVNYPQEWWHYSLAVEPYPRTFFDFPVTHAALATS
jgi:D-alanyl-D-alanine dipeptidase